MKIICCTFFVGVMMIDVHTFHADFRNMLEEEYAHTDYQPPAEVPKTLSESSSDEQASPEEESNEDESQ